MAKKMTERQEADILMALLGVVFAIALILVI